MIIKRDQPQQWENPDGQFYANRGTYGAWTVGAAHDADCLRARERYVAPRRQKRAST